MKQIFFLEFSCFFYDWMNVGSLIFGSFAFSKPSFNICWFLVHVLLNPSLENFEHSFASMVLPSGSAGKESSCSGGDLGSVPGLGRSPGEGKEFPLQYSGLDNPMDCIVHEVTKNRTWLSDFNFFQPVNNPLFNVHLSVSKNFYNCALTSCCS